LLFYLKSGRGFHANDTRGVIANNGVQTLPAAYGADLGLRCKPTPSLILTAAAWYLFLEQEFVYVGDAGVVEAGGRTRRTGIDLEARYQFTPQWFAETNINLAIGRDLDSEDGNNYIPLAPNLTSTGGIYYRPEKGLNGSLRYRYIKDRPANSDNTVTAEGYFIVDAAINYTQRRWEVGIVAENLLNSEWNEAQFDTESRLFDEPEPVSELHFTPGHPLFIKGKIAFFF
jgi:outer membrane receptor protein involved in Fe transport